MIRKGTWMFGEETDKGGGDDLNLGGLLAPAPRSCTGLASLALMTFVNLSLQHTTTSPGHASHDSRVAT